MLGPERWRAEQRFADNRAYRPERQWPVYLIRSGLSGAERSTRR
jgi:hypothetical protein